MNETIKNQKLNITVGTLIAVAGFVIYTTISVSAVINDLTNQVSQHEIKSSIIDERSRQNVDELRHLEADCQKNEVQYAAIEAKLAGIEALLVELRNK